MTLQAVRGVYEKAVIDAVAPVPAFVQNQAIGDFDAKSEYCFVRVNFGVTSELSIGCEPMEFLRGALVCEIYTRKNEGPARGLELITPVIRKLCTMNKQLTTDGQVVITRVAEITGPSQTALDDQPHLLTRFSCGFRARYEGA